MVSLHRENATIADVITIVNIALIHFLFARRLHGVCRVDGHEDQK